MEASDDESSTLNDYTLHEQIGKGTFGSVYRGIHKLNQKEFAIKIIELEKLKQTPNGILRVKTEIELQSKLNHDGIVKLYTSFVYTDDVDQSQKYILVLEYCNGGTLYDYLQKQKCGKLSESQSYVIFCQLVEIVRYLHQNHIIHRDLKLRNILLMHPTNKLSVKLCDFGLATSTQTCADHYTWCGTPNFCPPEIANHQKHGNLVDVWSLGICLITMLTGSPPFHSDNTKQTLHKIINHDKIKLPNYLSNSVKILITKLVDKSPTQRINTYDIFNEQWMIRKGKPLHIINIKHLKSRKKYLKKLNVTVEIIENKSGNIWWYNNQCYLKVFGNKKVSVMDIQRNIKKEYDTHSLPIQYYKLYDILSSFISIISSQTPIIALFITQQNEYKLKRIILLHNRDIDFTFPSSFVHYSLKTDAFEHNGGNHEDGSKIKLCKELIDRIYEIYNNIGCVVYPIELKFYLNTKTAVHHFEENKWKFVLPSMICTRIKHGKSKQIFEFEDNADISIVIEGKHTPYLIEKGNKDKIEITSKKGNEYNKYWKCITTVLQL